MKTLSAARWRTIRSAEAWQSSSKPRTSAPSISAIPLAKKLPQFMPNTKTVEFLLPMNTVFFKTAFSVSWWIKQENVLRDPRYKDVIFVLVHGGWPYEKEAALLTAVRNVYLDTSFQSELLYPSQFKDVLKQMITLFPDKMMYGSDAFPFSDVLGAEESFWLAAHTTRTALAAALAELVSERAITQEKALELARLYLHDNAAKLYGSSNP